MERISLAIVKLEIDFLLQIKNWKVQKKNKSEIWPKRFENKNLIKHMAFEKKNFKGYYVPLFHDNKFFKKVLARLPQKILIK